MSCTIPEDRIAATIDFHGHFCPGLAIGIRAAEVALSTFGDAPIGERLTVAETDMCGVDAIQFLTGCTFGKGNLVHRDLGKMAFSFYDRRTGEGIRALFRPQARAVVQDEYGPLSEKVAAGEGTDEDARRLENLRDTLKTHLLALDLDSVFAVQPLEPRPPRRARILKSLVCDACGETVMESRTRRFGGKTLCIPCFETVEQKI